MSRSRQKYLLTYQTGMTTVAGEMRLTCPSDICFESKSRVLASAIGVRARAQPGRTRLRARSDACSADRGVRRL